MNKSENVGQGKPADSYVPLRAENAYPRVPFNTDTITAHAENDNNAVAPVRFIEVERGRAYCNS